jgi:ankyrin repeat protein
MARRLIQPEELKNPGPMEWSVGDRQDVWSILDASVEGRASDVHRLLDKDPQLANCQWSYFTPLHFSVREGHAEVAELLLSAGADPTYESGLKWMDDPLTMARDRGFDDIVELIETAFRSRIQKNPVEHEIFEAIRQREAEKVHSLMLESPELVNACDQRGNTPLHWAVMTRQFPLIDEQLACGADINAKRPDGARPIDITNGDYFYRGGRDLPAESLREHVSLVGYLLAKGAEYDIVTACHLGDLERVAECIEQEPECVNRVPDYSTWYGGLPLRVAAGKGRLNIVNLLLAHGANPNTPEPGLAPKGGALHAASGGGHIEIAKLLLAAGADPNAEVESSGSCMSIAEKNPETCEEMQKLLAAEGGTMGITALCYLGRTTTIAELLAADPSLAHGGGDYGPLCMAVGFNHDDIVRMLLRNGADLNAPWYANNYMGYAMSDNNIEMVGMLLERGADPNNANWVGVTYLHKAAAQGSLECAEALIEFGADLNSRDDEYRSTPLGWAARSGRKEMVEFLIDRGAEVQFGFQEPWATPQAWAERRGHARIAEILRSQSAG